MTNHRISLAIALALAAAACEPGVPQSAPPASVVTAVFDPQNAAIPLPNDLVLQGDPTTLKGVSPAQAELLTAFKNQKGFPNDQEVAVTIDFSRVKINADGSTTNVAVALDTATLTPDTLLTFLILPDGSYGTVALDPIQATDYVVNGDHGTLTLHNKGHQPWTPGEYVIAVRGGPSGVKTTAADGAEPVYASQVFFLLAQGQPLETEQNIALLRTIVEDKI